MAARLPDPPDREFGFIFKDRIRLSGLSAGRFVPQNLPQRTS
jgi:hypothetical protein